MKKYNLKPNYIIKLNQDLKMFNLSQLNFNHIFFKCRLIVLILSFKFYTSYCQNSINYTNKNGLPSNNVYSIKQDKRGFIWATTDKGVVKYDGRNFKLFTIDNGLASNDNFVMLIDSKDNIWLYSFKAISKIEPDGICKVFGNTKSYFSHFIINDKDELFYSIVDYKEKFPIHFNIKNSVEKPLTLPICNNIFALGILYDNEYLIICKNKRLELYKLNTNSFQSFNNSKLENQNEFLSKNDPTFELIKSKNIYYWFKENYYFKENELNIRDGQLNNIKKYPNNIKKIGRGNILSFEKKIFVVFNKGIYSYDIESDSWANFLSHPKATSILIDHEKNNWVSTMGDGIIKYSNLDIKSGQETVLKLFNDPIKKVTGFKNQSLWVANSRNEVMELNKKKTKYTPDLIDLRFLETDYQGDLYFGGSNAVFQNGKIFSQYGFKAMALKKDSIALCTTFGSNFLNTARLSSLKEPNGRPKSDVTGRMYAILLLDGKFYAGNQQGLFWGKPTVNALYPICLDDDEESVSVNGIKKSKDGFIWVATEGNGVYLLKDDVVIRHFNSELLDANIHSMKTDEKDRVWLATRKGVNMIQKVGNDFQIKVYTSFHGLPDDYVNDIYCYDDILYVATDEGLVKLDISQINEMNFYLPPPIHINSMKVLRSSWKKVNHDTLYTFEHDENTVNFEYSGISYKSNGKVKFEYRLTPSVKEWLQTNNDNITFNNLDPNNYTFEVRAIDAIGNVSTKPAQTKFVIKKHYTDQFWFTFLLWLTAFFIILFVVLRYYKYRRLQAEESSRVEKLISELRLKSLQAQLNPHFIFNSLNAIQQFINTENKKSANDYLSRFARLMRLYLSGSDTQFISLAQELEVLKLYCSLEHLRFADKFQYSIQIDEKLPLEEYKVPAMLLQPHVENAIRHGLIPSDKDNNLLSIVVIATVNGIVCIIQDNGIGRARSLDLKKHRSSNHRSMGNKISKERLDMIRSLNLANISEDITDIINSKGEICGTNVEIKITKNS